MSDPYLESVVGIVERCGWAIQGVGGGSGDPPFAYTIGLFEKWNHPEVLLVGSTVTRVGQAILNNVGLQVSKGVRFGSDENYPGILENYRVAFRPIPDVTIGHWFNIAAQYYGGYNFSALQCFLPDVAGRFPFDDGYDYTPQPVPYDNT